MRKVWLFLTSFLLLISLAAFGCAQPAPSEQNQQPPEGGVGPKTETPPQENAPADDSTTSFRLTSPAFADGAEIPVKYTCHGQNVSPPLDWSQGPVGTASFALIMDDPDAAYTHWVIFNLPPDTRGLPEALPKDGTLASGALQGKNGGGSIRYIGPCPPRGTPHHYRFTLYALDKSLDLATGASKEQVLQAMQGHILAQSQLVGLYQR